MAAVACLALGLGSLAAVFTIVQATLLRDLPYRTPERIVAIWNSFPDRDEPRAPLSETELLDYGRQSTTLESVAGLLPWRFNLTGVAEPEQLVGVKVSPSFFPLLGVQAVVGRTFVADEGTPGKDRVVLLSHSLWQRRFGADPKIAGRALTLNGEPHVVAGVLPDSFRFAGASYDVVAPLATDMEHPMPRDARAVVAIGRLRDGVPLRRAQAEMDVLAHRLEQEYPALYTPGSGWGIRLVRLRDDLVGKEARSALLLLFLAGGLVLLTACGNVLNLLLARATQRSRELAIRSSLGAGPTALVQPFVLEAIVLTVAGGALGLLLAAWGLGALVAAGMEDVPRLDEISVDRFSIAVNLGLAAVIGLLFGVIAAAWAFRHSGHSALKEGGGRSATSRRGQQVRGLLVTAQVALALLVLIGTGLLLRSFLHLRQVDPGFRQHGVLTYQVFLPRPDYKEPAKTLSFFARLLSETGALPGVRRVAAVSDLPFSGNDLTGEVAAEGAPPPRAGAANPAVSWRIVTPDYFDTLGIHITNGRAFRDADDTAAPGVVVVDSRLAQRLWPGQPPLGKRLSLRDWARSDWLTVVGVAAPVKHESLTAEPREQLYLPLAQNTRRMMSVVVRTEGNPASLAGAVRKQVWRIAPNLPVVNLRPLDEIVATTTSRLSFDLWLFGTFAVVAAALATLGVYSLASFAVAQRTRDMAIRMALGASRADIFRLVLRQSALHLLPGLALGLTLSFWLSRLLRSQLFGMMPSDPLTLVAASVVISVLGILASYLPARRATQVDLSQAFGRD